MSQQQPKNPLHGITLKVILEDLVARRGWAELGSRIHIRCFTHDPSLSSSLKFLRKTEWARNKVEQLYLADQRRLLRESGREHEPAPAHSNVTDAEPMLLHVSRHEEPFPYFKCSHAFAAAECAILDGLFSMQDGWQARDDSFYSCFLREVTAEIPAELLSNVLARIRSITGLPLTDDVVVSAQRMEAGQSVGTHSDRPLLGYEVARLVLQLNDAWRLEHGGALELYESPDGAPVVRLEPRYNTAFGFLLHEMSYHGVAKVTQTRRSVVFNFWHAANSPALAQAVEDLFADMRFSDLPLSLESIAAAAESHLPEDVTYRASLAALALQRWGYDDSVVVRGYQFGAGLGVVEVEVADDRAAAVRLADWIARLHTGSFDHHSWLQLQRGLANVQPTPALLPFWRLCLPDGTC